MEENRLGVEIIDVALINLHPPIAVAGAYLDVISAEIDAVRYQAEALGDQNIVQARLVAKYRIADPVRFQLWFDDPEGVLHEAVLAALARTVAGWAVDDVLRLQRTLASQPGTVESPEQGVRRPSRAACKEAPWLRHTSRGPVADRGQ